MATKFYLWSGSIKWAKVTEASKDTKFDDDGIYSVDFYPDNPASVTESGIQVEPKQDQEGQLFFRLRRKHIQAFGKEFKTLGPPEVRMNKQPYTGSIGNGSKVLVNVAVFDTRKGKGHRLERITINELVEYNKVTEDQDDEIPF